MPRSSCLPSWRWSASGARRGTRAWRLRAVRCAAGRRRLHAPSDGTQLFYLRALSILGPLTLAFAGAGAVALAVSARAGARLPGLAAAAVALALVGFASAQRGHYIVPFVDRDTWQIRAGAERLPPGASVRVDVRPFGAQHWAGYMLAPHRLTAIAPLQEFFPYPPVGRKATSC